MGAQPLYTNCRPFVVREAFTFYFFFVSFADAAQVYFPFVNTLDDLSIFLNISSFYYFGLDWQNRRFPLDNCERTRCLLERTTKFLLGKRSLQLIRKLGVKDFRSRLLLRRRRDVRRACF